MRLKLDENLGKSSFEFLSQVGHEVTTVRGQGLAGVSDDALFQICATERRTLLTLDRDFAHVPRFPPGRTAGIVLELGGPASLRLLLNCLRGFLTLAANRSPEGELWIVEPGRVRVHLAKEREDR